MDVYSLADKAIETDIGQDNVDQPSMPNPNLEQMDVVEENVGITGTSEEILHLVS